MNQHDLQYTLDSYTAAKNRQDVDGLLAVCHEECYYESKPLGPRVEGKTALSFFYHALFSWLPDYRGKFEGQVLDRETLATWGTFGGTVKGEFLGVKPTGRKIEVPVVFIVTFKDGLIASDVGYFDLATLCEQGGLSLDQLTAASRAVASEVAV